MKGPSPVVVGSLAAIGAGWLLYLRNPGRSLTTAAADLGALVTGSVNLSATQRAMADIISREFGSAGFGWLANAAICNAYAESRLDPAAIGDNGHAVGLFQLNDASTTAAGYGMTVDARRDPVINTRRILDIVRGSDGAAVRAARGSSTHAQLARLFAHHIERCAACGWSAGSEELDSREQLTHKLFGDLVALTVP